jgi:hypothetical protein
MPALWRNAEFELEFTIRKALNEQGRELAIDAFGDAAGKAQSLRTANHQLLHDNTLFFIEVQWCTPFLLVAVARQRILKTTRDEAHPNNQPM